ncbi:MAG: hypothetical protein ACFFBD_13940 [Candidatus Hodarchaeota archaeon]
MIQVTMEDFKSYIARMGTPLFFWEDERIFGCVYLASLEKVVFLTFDHSSGHFTLDDPQAFTEIILDQDQFEFIAQLIASREKIDPARLEPK